MNGRMNDRRNGSDRRRENDNRGGDWSPRWSDNDGPSGYGGRYGDPYGPESPIDFGQGERYDDPYRDYQGSGGQGRDYQGFGGQGSGGQGSQGGSRFGGRYESRGDYRGNDPEFGYHQPGGPQGGSRFGSPYGPGAESRWEAPERGFPHEQEYGRPEYGSRRDTFSQQQQQQQQQQGRQQSRPWSQQQSDRYEGSGNYGGEEGYGSWGYQSGSIGERPENRPGLNRRGEMPQGGYRESGWSSFSNRSNDYRSGGGQEDSSWDQPWNAGPYSGRGPKGYQRSDDQIREDVCERLSYHGFIDPSEVDIEVEKGEVKLSGACANRREKRMIEDVADSVRGVRDIRNDLSIGRSDETEGNRGSQRFGSSNDEGQQDGTGSSGRSTGSRSKSSNPKSSNSKRNATTT